MAKNSRASSLKALLAAVALAPALSGCVVLAATGLVAGAAATREERTIGNAVDDVRIKSTLQSRMAGQDPTILLNVSITVIEGRVLMTGRVAEPQARLDATRVAWSVDGVRRVDNDIEVTDQTGWLDRPKDIWIRTQVAALLLGVSQVKDRNYTVDTVNGVVYLTGVAQSEEEIARAVDTAKSVDGVKRVESYVVTKDDPSRYGYGSPPSSEPAPLDAQQPGADQR